MTAADKQRRRLEGLLLALATGLFAAYLCFVAPSILESSDYVLMWKPVWRYLTDSLREGVIPLWNPYIGLGRPYLVDAPNAVFYPATYLICLGDTAGVFLGVWLHCLLAAFGMRRLAAALQVGRWQGGFMVMCFLASGGLTARWMTGQITYCWALCYLPWLFYCAVRTDEPWQGRRVAAHALLLALQFLCGSPQVFWFSAIGQGVFILCRAARLPVRETLAEAGRGLSQFVVALAWCAGLVAVILLPFLQLVRQGNRTTPSPALSNFLRLEWSDLATLVVPVGTTPHNWEMNLFVGVIVLVLGVAGLCRLREPNVRGLLGVSIIGLLIALAGNTPFFGLFYRWLPGFTSFRAHAREGFLAEIVLICAAGIWLSRPHPRLRAAWTGLSRIPVRSLFVGLFLLQALNLCYATSQIKSAYSFYHEFHFLPDFPLERKLVQHLQNAGLLDPSQPPPRIFAFRQLAPPNDAMIHRYANFDAYFPLFLRRTWDYLHRRLGLQPSAFDNTAVASEVYGHGPFPYPDLPFYAALDTVGDNIHVAANPPPRAFLVCRAEVVPDYDAILARLAGGHDIHQSALLEQPVPIALPPDHTWPGMAVPIRRFEPNSIQLDTDAPDNAMLILAEAWYPGWRAEIDGRDYPTVPANIWMRAVPVPAGRHHVRFHYHQDYLLPGLLVSAASACLQVIVLLSTTGNRRPKPNPTAPAAQETAAAPPPGYPSVN